ncbi:RNA-dependent RNA polymerase [Colletotrichum tofieldiae]|nr:RNA-dependent RNA polymerase [Colletotrichum tofieldiae]
MSFDPNFVLRPNPLDPTMAPQTEPPQPDPRTPKKPTQGDRVRDVVDKLNRDYNLSIEIPDVTLTPLSTRARALEDVVFARCEDIVRQIRYHCFQTTLLDKILHTFHMEARAASQNWIRLSDGHESLQNQEDPPRQSLRGRFWSFRRYSWIS